MEYASKLIEDAVKALSAFPGIGEKSALRHVLYLLKSDEQKSLEISRSIRDLRTQIKRCEVCCNYSDESICGICQNQSRDQTVICIVESAREVMAIENTGIFKGLYHVLGGLIAPVDGIGPNDLNIEQLVNRLHNDEVKEVIFALSPTMEGETTQFYLSKRLSEFDIKLTSIARGVSFGGELEYADELTLAKSLTMRRGYETN